MNRFHSSWQSSGPRNRDVGSFVVDGTGKRLQRFEFGLNSGCTGGSPPKIGKLYDAAEFEIEVQGRMSHDVDGTGKRLQRFKFGVSLGCTWGSLPKIGEQYDAAEVDDDMQNHEGFILCRLCHLLGRLILNLSVTSVAGRSKLMFILLAAGPGEGHMLDGRVDLPLFVGMRRPG